jgi:hypothetical protein
MIELLNIIYTTINTILMSTNYKYTWSDLKAQFGMQVVLIIF